ncbi:hypothetical protein ACFP1I_19710 [Dyadobacter subterraneus]|uniref:Uncharacterized protein n=1 Tax=Dyadobacter subterraneus TaxID=2773304 RepID=A0ABR9W632_9BACT|nr:hypothetical protein [Dyadobacter subterraneus]MBE9460920.1 hypothetical protein [Dyadobacter subterraneus]
MKNYFIILLTTINSIAFGQSRSVSRSIEDDGKSVSIHISGTIDGQTIKYDHTFDLSFLDKSERLALKEKVLDSLDLSFPPPPEPPIPPLFSDEDPEEEVSKADDETVEIEKTEHTETVCDKKQPFSKQIKYNAEGQMYMHYQFVKNGEDFEYERTLNANGKSESERQRIIAETEQEIGFSIDK